MPLNDLRCKNAKPKPKSFKLFDSEGLYLLINPNGSKQWRFKYRYLGKEKLLSFGAYPETSLLDARAKRIEAKAVLKKGIDPTYKKVSEELQIEIDLKDTFEVLIREWHERVINNWSEDTGKRVLRKFENELFPTLGKTPIRQLTSEMLTSCLQKTGRRSPILAKRLLGWCKKAFASAEKKKRIDANPANNLEDEMEIYIPSNFSRIELEQLPEFLDALFSPPPMDKIIGNYATRLVVLFGTRTKELLEAETKEFHREKSLWVVNSERVKKSRKQARIKRSHLVPIARQAEKILQELDRLFGKERQFLFPSQRKPNQPICKHAILKELNRIGYKSVMTGHGARSLMMDVGMEQMKASYHVIDRQLGHVPNGEVMRAYNRANFIDERAEFMQAYADKLEETLFKHQQERRDKEEIIFQSQNCGASISKMIIQNTYAPQ